MITRPRHRYRHFFLLTAVILLLTGAIVLAGRRGTADSSRNTSAGGAIIAGSFDPGKQKTDAEWRRVLTPEQYHILREAGTEIPFTGALNSEKRSGTYYSVGCDVPLFRSEQKYDSGTGWPSFWAPIDAAALVLRREDGPGDDRIEVLDTCGGHLGHVFDDGPPPTGKRYCMNSAALRFVPDEQD